MKKINKKLLAAVMLLTISIHIQAQAKGANHAVHHSKENIQLENQLNAVVIGYLAIKEALTKDDKEVAAAKAKELNEISKTLDKDKLSIEENKAWMEVLQEIQMHTEHINGAKDIAHQREHFQYLSQNVYKIVKSTKGMGTIYFQHCPMFNKGKGANWLSRESEIHNPYYGLKMPDCGETTEVITN